MRLLGWMLPGPAETTLPPPASSDYRVLFLRYERIGDMIMATSVIRNIAAALPSGKVDVLATPTTAPVLEGNPYVGNVLTLERKSVRSYGDIMKRLRREHYTVMVDGNVVKYDHRLLGIDLAKANQAIANTVEYARSKMGEQAWNEGMNPEKAEVEYIENPYTYTERGKAAQKQSGQP